MNQEKKISMDYTYTSRRQHNVSMNSIPNTSSSSSSSSPSSSSRFQWTRRKLEVLAVFVFLAFATINTIQRTNIEIESKFKRWRGSSRYDYQTKKFIRSMINDHYDSKDEDQTTRTTTTTTATITTTTAAASMINSGVSSYQNQNHTALLPSDVIVSRQWWEKPTVIEEYKLIFFSIPKVACTEWKLMFRRMNGLSYQPPPRAKNVTYYQNPHTNKLKTLDQYPLDVAENMMNSPEWTRAIFVREPKDRIRSSFMNKFVRDRYYFRDHCCSELQIPDLEGRRHCHRMINRSNLTYFLERTQDCHDPHWDAQFPVVDEKWWKSMSFVGKMESMSSDAKTLLQSLSNGEHTAWEKYGSHGWGKNGTESFMQNNSAGHSTREKTKIKMNATERLCTVLRPEDEAYIEKHWHVEWDNHQYMGYEKMSICSNFTAPLRKGVRTQLITH